MLQARPGRRRSCRRGRRAALLARILLLLTLLTAVVACSDNGDDDESSKASETSETSAGGSGGDDEAAADKKVEAQSFVTRPDLTPPVIDVEVSASSTPGLLFLAPKRGGAQRGALIMDDDGEVVWSHPSGDDRIADFRVQTYQGEPVLTWFEGRSHDGYGQGEFVIADTAYHEVARVRAGNGLAGDLHEFQLTDEGTALIGAYEKERVDLTAFDGPADGWMLNGYVQEVDVATGKVLFEWNAHDHVPLAETYRELVPDAAATENDRDEDGTEDAPFDWFHINSVAEDGDGGLLVSARNTHAVYAIDRGTGEVRFTLGGKASDYTMGDATFAWQHDARRLPDGTISLFDNQADPPMADESRGLIVALDDAERSASVVRTWVREPPVLAGSQGNTQVLADGGAVIGWGSEGRVTEFDPEGAVVFDATWAPADSYRVYRLPWSGQPTTTPDVVARRTGDGSATEVYVSWNGATDVAEWRVSGGAAADALEPLATVAKDGFETRLEIDPVDHVAVEALDSAGNVLATTASAVDAR